MCAEAHPSRCHRRLLADYLCLRGAEVIHILDADRAESHEPPAALRPAPEGHPIYPTGDQLDLFPKR